jgi:hypothetical protein
MEFYYGMVGWSKTKPRRRTGGWYGCLRNVKVTNEGKRNVKVTNEGKRNVKVTNEGKEKIFIYFQCSIEVFASK